MNWMRKPQTANERRAAADPDLEEYGVQVRASRAPTHLPTDWDDMPRSEARMRGRPISWKNNRGTQYR